MEEIQRDREDREAEEDGGERRAREQISPPEHLPLMDCNNRFRIFNKKAQQISLL